MPHAPMPPGIRCSAEFKTQTIDDPPTWSQCGRLETLFHPRAPALGETDWVSTIGETAASGFGGGAAIVMLTESTVSAS
jgi:hypothetical protein